MANTTPVTNFDPDSIKTDLVSFMQGNTIFQDYNFSGSNLSVLVELLSRNTFLNAFVANMTFPEAFNDSAQLRDSLVSKAKELNYIPYSVTSATTTVNVAIQTANLTIFEIPKGTIFNGQNSNGTFSFVTDQPYVQTSSNSFFLFPNVAIYEGFYSTDLFTVDSTVNNQLFTLSNPGVDITSLSVLVANTPYNRSDSVFGLSGNSNVFYLQASSGNTYQFQFGDGILGRQPDNGSIVSAQYRVAKGEAANFVNTFSTVTNLAAFNSGSISSISIKALDFSSGGFDRESIDSIRFNNPKHNQTQGNIVSSNDYKTTLLENFPSIKDINVYGGGVTPQAVQYGVVFLSMITKSGNPPTNTIKNNITSFLADKTILNIPPSIVDPEFLFIGVNSNVHVDFTSTTLTPNDFRTAVVNAISVFSNTNLEKFNTNFRFSKLSDAIDNLDDAIESNETTITLKKFANTTLNVNNSISINYSNPIVNVTSSAFVVNGSLSYVTDTINSTSNGGVLFLTQYNSNNSIISTTNVGTVNYANGTLTIPSLNFSGFPSNASGLAFIASPANKDQYANGNMIIEIDSIAGVTVNVSNN